MFNRHSLIYRGFQWSLHRFIPIKRRRLLTTVLQRWLKLTDKRRWSKVDNLHHSWEERTRLMAQWIPAGASVLEFGCGTMCLQQYLPKDSQYTPSDLVKRDEHTLVIDLNQPILPKLPDHDVYFFSGVLEYVFDLGRLIEYTTRSCQLLIVSYASCEVKTSDVLTKRRIAGWVNDYSEQEFTTLILKKGFSLIERKMWKEQILYLFARDSSSYPAR